MLEKNPVNQILNSMRSNGSLKILPNLKKKQKLYLIYIFCYTNIFLGARASPSNFVVFFLRNLLIKIINSSVS